MKTWAVLGKFAIYNLITVICVLPNVYNILSGFYTACMVFAPEADEEWPWQDWLGHNCSISGDYKYSCKA